MPAILLVDGSWHAVVVQPAVFDGARCADVEFPGTVRVALGAPTELRRGRGRLGLDAATECYPIRLPTVPVIIKTKP